MFKRVFSKLKSYNYKKFNLWLVLLIGLLCTISIKVIDSAAEDGTYAHRQLLCVLACGIMVLFLTLIDYHFILRLYWGFYILSVVLLIYVFFFGETHKGAQRWMVIQGIQIQPSELVKVFIILFFSHFFAKYKEKISKTYFLLITAGLIGLQAGLVYIEPDLSTTIVILLIFCVIIFVAGLSYKVIGVLFMIAIPLVVVLFYLALQPNQTILQTYQLKRIVAFYQGDKDDPETAKLMYQQENSELAIGSGGLYGKGLNNNTITSVKNGNYLSEIHTDFIFTVIGEELGFVGGACVIITLALITLLCFKTGSRAPDDEGKYLCCGVGAWIGIQTIINIAVVTKLIPNTGLTLPFVSYGLASLVSLFIGIGIVLNVSLQCNTIKYEEVLA